MEERREYPRTAGIIKKIEDITYDTLRQHNLAEPAAKCADCGTPLESGHKCEHC